jgi:hypothetical protein
MTEKLTKAVREQKQQTKQKELEIYGTLGIPLDGQNRVDVPNRASYVYVKLRDNPNEVIQAFNNQVAASFGLPVIIQRQGNRYIVLGVNTERYQSNWTDQATFLPKHGGSHSFSENGGGDPVWVYGRQIIPALLYPSSLTSGSNVKMGSYLFSSPSGWKTVGGTGTPNLFTYNPTGSNAVMILVYLDNNTGNPNILVGSGSYFPNQLTGTSDITPYIPNVTNPSVQIPLGAIRLASGTSLINWDNIYDARQWIHALPTGTSSGGGGTGTGITIWDEGVNLGFASVLNVVSPVADISVSGTVARLFITGSSSGGISGISGSFIQDEGIPKGFVTTFNFVGDNVDASVSGSVARIFVTGSMGGTNPPVSGSFVVQNNGINLGSATTLNFTNGLSASISGTVANIMLTGTSTATYIRTAVPTTLSNVTGTYWKVPDSLFVTGSLAVFNQGHALIPGTDYSEQHANSGTYQYFSLPPTGTYNLVIYGIPVPSVASSGGGGGGTSQFNAIDFPPSAYFGFSGTWTYLTDRLFYNSTHNNGDYLDFYCWLNAGNYTLYMNYAANVDRGICNFRVDGVSVGTIDTNVGSGDSNRGSISFSNSVAGLKTLRMGPVGTNSSNYFIIFTSVALFQTG